MSIERPHSAPIEFCAPNPFIGSDEADVIGLVNGDDLLVVLVGMTDLANYQNHH